MGERREKVDGRKGKWRGGEGRKRGDGNKAKCR